MDFFQPIISNPNASQETLEKQRLSWNSGLRGQNNSACKLSEETKANLKGKKAWNKGICHLDESAKKRISEARKNLLGVTGKYVRTSDIKDKQREGSSIPVMTPDGIFSSKGEAAEFYGIHRNNFSIRMKKFPEKYYALVERNNKGNPTKGLNRKGGRV